MYTDQDFVLFENARKAYKELRHQLILKYKGYFKDSLTDDESEKYRVCEKQYFAVYGRVLKNFK